MTSDDYRRFVTIVAGNNPEALMIPYDSKKEIEPYVLYKISEAEQLKAHYMEMYEALLNNKEISKEERKGIQADYDIIKKETPTEFFYEITDGMEYDEKTGDAISTVNKFGKWSHFQLGKDFCIPFIKKDGEEVSQCLKKEVDWEKMHLNNKEVYQRAWEMVMEGDKPQTETEEIIYNNMKNRSIYFQKFKTKENYVMSSTAFWGYAFLSEKTGWVQLEDNDNQYEWVSTYYDKYIKPLPEGTKLTIFECIK